jgi:subtilisin
MSTPAQALSKVVSSNVEDQLKATGEAQVIVLLAPPKAGLAAAIAKNAGPSQDLLNCFTLTEKSRWSAIARATSSVAKGVGLAAGAAVAMARQVAPVRHYPNLNLLFGNVDRDGLNALSNSSEVEKIAGAPQISLIAPKRTAPARLTAANTWGIERLKVPLLWKQGLSGKKVLVAHLDTGVDGKHPALRGGAIAEFVQFDDLGARVSPDPAPFDSGEHGTHTAGTIAGRPVKKRSIGVAPGAQLLSAMVIEGGSVIARVLGGLDWAIENKPGVLSMSLGFPGFVNDFIDIFALLRQHDILPCIAVGNDGPGTSRSPGNYTDVISVGACDVNSAVADFSSSQNFARAENPLVPDLLAPGVNVISAKPGGSFQAMDGTSMATPHMAGLAALLREAAPDKSATDVENAIYQSCALPPGIPSDRGNRGVPDATAAFKILTGTEIRSAASGKKSPAKHKAPSRSTRHKRKR